MPQNALDNRLVLPMLGLLVEHPRHQYALLRDLRERYPFLQAKTSTVYTLVRSLARHRLVDLVAAAAGSERQQVRLTDAGFADFRERVENQLAESDPNIDPKFMIALAYVGVLGPERAAGLLRDRAARLRSDRLALTGSLDRADLQEVRMIEVHFLVSRLRHDAAWLAGLAERIDDGQLDWPAPPAPGTG